ncbi:MAG: VWA domain-containing protein [Chloroflexi bacterium]|nr:MAG: VWA domain-containing protein [Chloroflexota bacterium]
MQFIWPTVLLSLILVPVLVGVYIWLQRRRRRYAVRYASLSLVRDAMGNAPGRRRHVPPALFLLAVAFMLVAAARPQMVVAVPAQEGTVILAIDVSGSMQATDVQPNRMEAAKSAAMAFVDKQGPAVQIGVVSFSGDASIVQTPTTDKDLVRAAIARLRPQRATAIGRGILVSLDAIFTEDEVPPSAKYLNPGAAPATPAPTATGHPNMPGFAPATIVLMTDGQNNQFPQPLAIIDEAINRGVRVYTVGLGTPQGTVLRLGGRAVRTALDETTLKSIAQLTDAEYFNASNANDLKKIYENLATQFVLRQEKTEITAYFTIAAALLSLAAVGLSMLWFGRLL